MALKDSFINLNKALRTTLQNVPAVVDTLIRGFDEIGDAADAQTTYSTDERVVGKWIDGSDVYEKVINFGKLPNATTKSVAHGITYKEVVFFSGVATSASDVRAMPSVSTSTYFITITMNTTHINILVAEDFSTYDGYITIRYTKPSTSRSPENDIKNVIDDEPDVKTVEEPAEELKK